MKTPATSETNITPEQLEIAYKKLKSCVYYDKTQIILRNKIIKYEENYEYNPEKINKRFEEICAILNNTEIDPWKNYVSDILNSIKVLYFPKKLKSPSTIPINQSSDSPKIANLQSFIDLDVEGQLLGILWIIKIGKFLDKNIYEHSYGNRIKIPKSQEKAVDIEEDFSPNLFAPYFLQYENWRDTALKKAKEIINDKHDVMILTMDFSRFYYNINISKSNKKEYYKIFKNNTKTKHNVVGIKRLNSFIYSVLKKYSKKHKDAHNQNFLPIGFFPSNIIANYCLKKFDEAIIEQWNPSYYGRYVDDIIIVNKVTGPQPYIDIQLTPKNIIEKFLCNTPKELRLLISNTTTTAENIYSINPLYLNNKNSNIQVQKEKTNAFYFKKTGSTVLIDKFRENLYKNTSEFRYLPEEYNDLDDGNYDEIFDLNSNNSINKFNSIKNITINKYSLSKFLGKRTRIHSLTNQTSENKFDKDILKIFDSWNIIDNFTLWDKLLQVILLNNDFLLAENFIKKIISTINNLQVTSSSELDDLYKTGHYDSSVKSTLLSHLKSAICHNLALIYGPQIKYLIKHLHSYEKKITSNPNDFIFSYHIILEYRHGYCYSRMCDKYATMSFIDFVICHDHTLPSVKLAFSDKAAFNLTHKDDYLSHIIKFEFDDEYLYYPYIITPQELSIAFFLGKIHNPTISHNIIDSYTMNEKIYKIFFKLNFKKLTFSQKEQSVQVHTPIITKENLLLYSNKIISSPSKNKSIFTISIGNTILRNDDFIGALTQKPIRNYERYKNLIKIINEAIKEHSDILILPEAYLPLEWLPIVARTCAKNQLALIAGIEHIVHKNCVFNFTATILPYKVGEFSFSNITYHLKVHYSPGELAQINGYNLFPVTGNSYDLFYWKDLWFSVYCCFELTSIYDRSLFKNCPDLIIGIEWNKDVKYFSNILEALCRDIHCYCAQVNSSNYGDSRIIQPSSSITKDILKTKGGINNTILIAKINIEKLRNFQQQEYSLQEKNTSFKPTPPQFDRDIVKHKIKGILWPYL